MLNLTFFFFPKMTSATHVLSNRTYRGYNLSPGVSDVTVENNLSRVITAISHALTSSTSRALTVSLRWPSFKFLYKFFKYTMQFETSIVFSFLCSFSLVAVRHYVCYPSLSQCATGAQAGTVDLSVPLCSTMAVPASTAPKHALTGRRSVCTVSPGQ